MLLSRANLDWYILGDDIDTSATPPLIIDVQKFNLVSWISTVTVICTYIFKLFYLLLFFRLSIIGEGDCFNYAFGYLLKNITMDDLVHPFEEKAALKSINEGTATYASVIAAMQAGVIKMTLPGVDPKGIFV